MVLLSNCTGITACNVLAMLIMITLLLHTPVYPVLLCGNTHWANTWPVLCFLLLAHDYLITHVYYVQLCTM